MKTEIINCDRCETEIPDGPPNSWFQNTVAVMWTANVATRTNDLCANCETDYQTFLTNETVNPR